jgi:hypothetical protein
MNKLEVLRGAREIIADESRWCIGTSARDKYGDMLEDPKSKDAVRFCAIGALARVGDDETVVKICASIGLREGHTLWFINDNRGREAAIAALDREIACCGGEVEAAKPVITFGLTS